MEGDRQPFFFVATTLAFGRFVCLVRLKHISNNNWQTLVG